MLAGQCQWSGVAIQTASMLLSSRTFRRSVTAFTPLCPAVSAFFAASASRLAYTTQTYAILTSLLAIRLLRWFDSIAPQPMRAMLSTSPAAALLTAAEAAIDAAVVIAAEE